MAKIATITGNSYNDDGVEYNTVYVYTIRGINIHGNGPFFGSNDGNSQPTISIGARPSFPITLTITPNNDNNGQIYLAWSRFRYSGTSHPGVYIIQRRIQGTTSWSEVGRKSPRNHQDNDNIDFRRYNDSAVVIGTTYEYRVEARTQANQFPVYSNVIFATPTGSAVPGISQNLSANALDMILYLSLIHI